MTCDPTTVYKPGGIMLQPVSLVDDELIGFLEPDQLVSDAARPVPRALLTTPVRAALWALRILTLLFAAAILYTFVAELVR